MTKDERTAEEMALMNEVYGLTVKRFERLEHAGAIVGNGHHMAQKLAEQARTLLRERWDEEGGRDVVRKCS